MSTSRRHTRLFALILPSILMVVTVQASEPVDPSQRPIAKIHEFPRAKVDNGAKDALKSDFKRKMMTAETQRFGSSLKPAKMERKLSKKEAKSVVEDLEKKLTHWYGSTESLEKTYRRAWKIQNKTKADKAFILASQDLYELRYQVKNGIFNGDLGDQVKRIRTSVWYHSKVALPFLDVPDQIKGRIVKSALLSRHARYGAAISGLSGFALLATYLTNLSKESNEEAAEQEKAEQNKSLQIGTAQ